MPDTTTATITARRKPQVNGSERIANAAFLIILLLTNVWFFTQAFAYVR